MQPASAGVPTHEPKDKDGFGHVLWLILGGKKAGNIDAAFYLDISAQKLSSIIHDRGSISQEMLANKYWREILAAYRPSLWRNYADIFEQRSMMLCKSSSFCVVPEDDGSFGHILWQILGGRDSDLTEAAKRLRVSLLILCNALHGKSGIYWQTLIHKKWRDAFANHYSDNWIALASIFEQRAKGLPRKGVAVR
jgi:hypothetical protein